MARAHRHYLPGQIWHLTHRCHERQFLLEFLRDRQAWMKNPGQPRMALS
jgi:putative transposase